MLELRLLGRFEATTNGAPIRQLDRPRLRPLLTRLATSPGVLHPRGALAAALWPDSPPPQSRTNLRNLLHKLRAALPNPDLFVALTATSCGWRTDAPCEVDAVELLARHAAARRAVDDTARLAALRDAAAWYRGDLVVDDGDEDLLTLRDELREVGRAVRVGLARGLLDAGDAAGAVDPARALVAADALDEDGCALLMEALLASGDRSGAVRAYHAYSQQLRAELDEAPGQSLRELHQQCARSEPDGGARDERAASAPPLIGRPAEVATLAQSWQRAARGVGAELALVRGEAGIGKTRLADEAARLAVRGGALCAWARCYAAEGDVPYAPAVAWLRADALAHHWATLDDVFLAQLAVLLPEIDDGDPEDREADADGDAPWRAPRWQRGRLRDAMTRAVLAAERPTALILDDVQWCDPETLEWLHGLVREAGPRPLWIVATLRTDFPPPPAASTLFDALQRERRLTTVDLGPLEVPHIAALAAHCLGAPSPNAPSADCARSPRGIRCSRSSSCAPAPTGSRPIGRSRSREPSMACSRPASARSRPRPGPWRGSRRW